MDCARKSRFLARNPGQKHDNGRRNSVSLSWAFCGVPWKRKDWFLLIAGSVRLGILSFFPLCSMWASAGREGVLPRVADRGSRVAELRVGPESAPQMLKAEAFEVARRLMEEFPEKADPILLMGAVHYRYGDTAAAESSWQKGLKLDPHRADAYEGMGWIAFLKADYETAISLWQKAIEIEPNMPNVHNNLARALMSLGRIKEAAQALEEEVRISPRSSQSHFLLGQAFFQLNRLENAKEAYERAIQINPASANAYYGLSRVFSRFGQGEKAREHLAKFRDLRAKDSVVPYNRFTASDDAATVRTSLAQTHEDAGLIYYKYGNLQQTEEHWQRAASLEPSMSSCRLQLASLYEGTNRITEAIRMYERVRDIEPDNAEHCHALATMYARVKRFADAGKTLKKAIELQPGSSQGYRDLARLYLTANENLGDARALAAEAVKLEPSAANYNILGWALYANGEVEASLSAIQRAMELDPTNAEYRRRYEQIRQKL